MSFVELKKQIVEAVEIELANQGIEQMRKDYAIPSSVADNEVAEYCIKVEMENFYK